MDRKKLNKLKGELDALRRGRHKARAFQSLAGQLGRRMNSTRGKHPVWESYEFPDLYPLSIPDHGHGKDISPGVQKTILNCLEEDIIRHEQELDDQEVRAELMEKGSGGHGGENGGN